MTFISKMQDKILNIYQEIHTNVLNIQLLRVENETQGYNISVDATMLAWIRQY